MKNHNIIIHYSILALILFGLVLIANRYSNKNQGNAISAKSILRKQSNNSFEAFEALIDLAEEISNYFKAFTDNDIEREGVDAFARRKINSYVSMEIKFDQISKKLKSINQQDETVKEISKIALNFSNFSKRYVEMILMLEKNPENLEIAAIKSRNDAELQRDWAQLQSLGRQFAEEHKDFLTKEDKSIICARIKGKFTKEISKFSTTIKEQGIKAAIRLRFSNGAWLPINILWSIDLEGFAS